jgi:hypothetical protein
MYNTASITKRRSPNRLLFGPHQLRNIMIKILLALIRAIHSNNSSIRVFAVVTLKGHTILGLGFRSCNGKSINWSTK